MKIVDGKILNNHHINQLTKNNIGEDMKNLLVILLTSTLLLSSQSFAGSDHEHGHGHSHGAVSADVVVEKALNKVKQLVDNGKIDASWKSVKSTGSEKKIFGKGLEWVVSFNNPKINDSTKKNLYIFFSLDGHYIAANYTGK